MQILINIHGGLNVAMAKIRVVEFSVKTELEDLHCVVHPTSQYICREKVDDLDNNPLRHYCVKAKQKGLRIKTKSTAKRSL